MEQSVNVVTMNAWLPTIKQLLALLHKAHLYCNVSITNRFGIHYWKGLPILFIYILN